MSIDLLPQLPGQLGFTLHLSLGHVCRVQPKRLAGLVKRMQIFTIVALLLTAWIVWISLNLTRIARTPA